MSHQRLVKVLAHNQPVTSTRTTLIEADIAAELLRRLAAEPIRQGLIRMLPPESVIAKAAPPDIKNFLPSKLPAREVSGCKFKAPIEHPTGIPRTRYLPTRREKFGQRQMEISLLPMAEPALA